MQVSETCIWVAVCHSGGNVGEAAWADVESSRDAVRVASSFIVRQKMVVAGIGKKSGSRQNRHPESAAVPPHWVTHFTPYNLQALHRISY